MSSRPSPFLGKRVLVLGASGFIGYWVARALRAQRALVTSAVRTVEGAERLTRERLGTVVVRRDLSDLGALAQWIPALRPSIVFNMAGYGVDRSERDEALATRINVDLVEALSRVVATLPHDEWAGLRLVHVGSALEYGTTGGTLREDSPCAPTTLYGISKLAGTHAVQRVVRETDLDACIARLFTVYGAGEHAGRLLPAILAAQRDGTSLDLTSGEQRRDFAYVGDVAEGLLRLAVSDVAPGEVVNLATGTMQSVRTFAESAARSAGLDADRLRFGALPTRPEEMAHDGVSVDRMRALTHWTPSPDLEAGIARALKRERETVASVTRRS